MARGVVADLADVCVVQMGEEWLLFLTGIAVEPEKKTPSVRWFMVRLRQTTAIYVIVWCEFTRLGSRNECRLPLGFLGEIYHLASSSTWTEGGITPRWQTLSKQNHTSFYKKCCCVQTCRLIWMCYWFCYKMKLHLCYGQYATLCRWTNPLLP